MDTFHKPAVSVVFVLGLIVAAIPIVRAEPIIPSDRQFTWNPGMMSKGGIPNRTILCTTLQAGNGRINDSPRLQTAIDNCPDGQVVMLGPGTFVVNTPLLVHTGITLRGSGPQVTILKKTNGAPPRTSTLMRGTISIYKPSDTEYTGDSQPLISVGLSPWNGVDGSTAQNLTADGQKGSYSVRIANGSGFVPGTFVLLDELSGASWQPIVPRGEYYQSGTLLWSGDRVAYRMHYPHDHEDDDDDGANLQGPYDSTPGTMPGAMTSFSRPDRSTNEIKEIASVSGNTITFTSPLAISYRVSHTAQLSRYTDRSGPPHWAGDGRQVTYAGVENLSLIGGGNGALGFDAAAYSWAKNIEMTQWNGQGITIESSFRVEIRDSYLHTASYVDTGAGSYILGFEHGSSECLVENNIMRDGNRFSLLIVSD